MKLIDALRFGTGLIIVMLLASCQSGTMSATPTLPFGTVTSTAIPQSSLTPTKGASLGTTTVTTITEPTSVPDLNPTPSPTIIRGTATPSPTLATPTIAAITLTPLPTFAAGELEVAVNELFANPMNCDEPCWWGAVPNKTTVFEVQQFLTPYQFIVRERYDNEIIDLLEVWVGYDESTDQFDFRVFYLFDGIVLASIFSEQSLLLHDMLIRFGQPDEVWLETMSFERETLPFRINMVYLQEGMAVGYVVDGDIQGDMVVGCYADEETGNLQLNIPGSSTGYSDFPGVFELGRHYKSLESATDLTIEDFMQLFSDPARSHCIETPTELWD